MNKQIALQIILGISLAGVLFSGTLSYFEIFRQVCAIGGSCTVKLLTIPSCVYGFFVFLSVLIVSMIGIRSK